MRALLYLLFGGALAQGAEPLRVAIVTRLNQALPESLRLFEQRHGAGRLDVHIGDPASLPANLEQAEVIFTYSLPADDAVRLAEPMRRAMARGAKVLAHWPEGPARHWPLRQDAVLLAEAIEYWNYGGVENMARFFTFLHTRVGGRSGLAVEPPDQVATSGIYHPKAPRPFVSLQDYLRWYRSQGLVPGDAPLAGVLFYHTNLKNRDMEHIDALIAAMERRGLGAVAVFGWPPPVCEPYLMLDGKPAVEALLALTLGFARPDDAAFLSRLNVHVIDLMTTRQTLAEWRESPHGVRTDQLAIQVAAPERAGATEPITFAATERSADGKATLSKPIAERVEMAVSRTQRWIHLRRKTNAEKKIAILYYNSPPGKGNIGASYLNVPGTLQALLAKLSEAGYRTGERLPRERQLLEALELAGRNIEEWAPGELESIVEKGKAILVSVKQYKEWLRKLPKPFQEFVARNWGPPEKSTLMTIRSRDGEPFCVIPAVRFGNVLLGPQPLRSSFALAGKTLHDTTIPPPHCYIAAYLWYRNVFLADAVAHVGRHGTLEFLPGKNVGQAAWDSSEVLLGDLPAPYFYILDGGGESTTARRRAASTMIGHLTPMLADAGKQEQFEELQNAFRELELTRETSPALAGHYRKKVFEEMRRHKLDSQLGVDLDKSLPEDIEKAVGDFLEDVEHSAIPLGVHTLGHMPREENLAESARELLRAGFSSQERKLMDAFSTAWATSIIGGTQPAVPADWPKQLQDKAAAQLALVMDYVRHVRLSPQAELEAFLRVLRGEYLESGPTGDPLRMPAVVPSGRNLHDFDPSFIPTKTACELGRALGDEVIGQYRKETGKPPRKVSMVLWYGETIRHQGAMECQALYLMGVEPQWNSRGVVDSLKLIPDDELGRPRIDVVLTIAGIYRDGFPDKALLLDKASRMVQSAGKNVISENTRRAMAELRAAGVGEAQAARAASARVFGPAPGDYGGGIANLVKQSRNSEDTNLLAEAYLSHNNFAYSNESWGESIPKALATQLKGNEVVVHSRATNLYGVTDNDDFFDFAGGLSTATKSLNGGVAPRFYVANLRKPGRERLERFQSFLSTELNARLFNAKWIREMQHSGYAGAREMFDHLENLYGWQATTPESMSPAHWENAFDVYVSDRHNLGMKKFFEKENPHARQYMLARLIEVDRQGSHRFSASQRAELLREFIRSVARFGAGCSANTCGNRKLQRFVADEGKQVGEMTLRELRDYARRLAESLTPAARRRTDPPAHTSGMGGAGNPRRGMRVFPVKADDFLKQYFHAKEAVPLGIALFALFLAGSLILGAAQALGLRWSGPCILQLDSIRTARPESAVDENRLM